MMTAGCGASGQLTDAAGACSSTAGQDLVPGDGGESISIRASSVDASNSPRTTPELVTMTSLCVLDELDVPDSVTSKVEATTSMDGRQADSWDGFDLSWTYHPDNGLEIIIET